MMDEGNSCKSLIGENEGSKGWSRRDFEGNVLVEWVFQNC